MTAALTTGCRHRDIRQQACGTALWQEQEYQRSSELCAQGDLKACVIEADALTRGSYFVPKDPARAKQLYERACAGGIAEACGRGQEVVPTAPPESPTAAPAVSPASST